MEKELPKGAKWSFHCPFCCGDAFYLKRPPMRREPISVTIIASFKGKKPQCGDIIKCQECGESIPVNFLVVERVYPI